MRALGEFELETLKRLHARIVEYQRRNVTRSNFAEGEERLTKLGFSIPPSMQDLGFVLGWPAQSCDAISERVQRKWFTARDKNTELFKQVDALSSEWHYKLVEEQAKDAALRHGVSFVFTSRGDTSLGEPEVLSTVKSALAATAEVDPRSKRTTAALEIVSSTQVNLYLPGVVLLCKRVPGSWRVEDEFPTGTSRVLCTPFVHDPTTEKPLGRSRITAPLMSLTMTAARTMLRQEVSADFYVAPRIIAKGGGAELFEDEAGNKVSPWSALTGAVWGVPDEVDEVTGERSRIDIQQLAQMSQQPFSDQMRLISEIVSGETGIPVSQLGLSQDSNPASEAAIVASENRLVRIAEKQFMPFGMAMRDLAVDQLHVLYGGLNEVQVRSLAGLSPRFEDPRTRSVVEQSQFVAQQVDSGNFIAGTLETLQELPIDPESAVAHAEANRRLNATASLTEKLAQSNNPLLEAAEARLKAYDALRAGVYAGGSFESVKADLAAAGIDVSGIEWSGTYPNTLRLPESEAETLEDA